MRTPRERCLIGRKWASKEPCAEQCKTCRISIGPAAVNGNPAEETPEGLYLSDKRRRETGRA